LENLKRKFLKRKKRIRKSRVQRRKRKKCPDMGDLWRNSQFSSSISTMIQTRSQSRLQLHFKYYRTTGREK